MEGLGKESSICSSKPFPWLGHPETQTSSRLWKLTDCFSTHEKTTNYAAKQKSYMDGRTPVLELKDVPPPPHHASSSKPFPLPLVPLPPHSLPASLLQDTLQAPQPQGGSPKVSLCTLCEHCSAGRYGGFSGGAGCTSSSSSSSSAGVSLYTSSSFQESHSSSSIQTRPSACLLGTALQSHQQYPSLGAGGNVLSTVHSSGGYQVQISSSVATSQPYTSHSHLSCCAGLFHSHPSVSLPYSQACMLPTLAPSLPDGLHSSCLVSSYPVGVGCSPTAREIHRNTVVSAARGDFHTTTTPAHLCSNPLHLNVDCTVCLQGSHYCRHCLTKPVRGLMPNPDKVWPNIPLPAHQSVPVPIPMCNGCGTSSEARLLLGPGIGMAGQKYGSPESGVPENVPPVGVFWDIENCCVPTGRSAAAVVQRIRSRFFQGHREAEFICVCDISKENKAVIQELNNCQVTVAHINATAKNAADDKLRQSLRRFAETHTAPATVVLVSSDVNFASELSDLRHRHGFQVVLVHKNQASPALLLHAHRHVAFEEITAELPPRMADKSQSSSNLLYVHNLPVNCFEKNVRSRLRRLSDNCGGKVLGLSSGTAVLRFGSHEAAERARKRMGNEDVFGCRISLSFSHQHDEDTIEPQPCQSTSVFPPPPPAFPFLPLDKPRSPRRSRRAARLYQTASSLASSSTVPERPYSPRRGCSGPPGGAPVLTKPFQELCGLEAKPKTGSHPLEKGRAASSSPHRISPDITQQQQHLKPALLGESMYRRRRDVSSPCNAPESPVQRVSRNSPEFQVSTPSAFSKLSIQRPFSPTVLPQGSWSSRSLSPSLSSRSSPLLVPPRSSGPQGFSEPFSDGADIQVANLDYRMSRKELQQILCDTFSRHGRVKAVELSPHTDYQLKATVQMMSLQQAISAVSGLHRCKIGGKRIHVSLMTGGSNKSLTMLSSEIISILHDAPASCLPLFKFTEIYEKKFAHKLVVNDLYRLPEVVAVREQGGTRLLCLLPSGLARQSPLGSSQSQDSSSASGSPVVFEELEYHEPVCRHHYLQQVFSEADFDPDLYQIPFVALSLKALASQVHSLLQTHEGMVPLLSFPECYAAEFTRLPLGHEGVPLEHLITCIPGITIVTAQNGFKVIKWIHNKPPAPNADPWVQRCKSPVGNPQLIQFSREVIDLMKSHPSCILPISKFIPAYHHHFAKQCRVSDYGYTKLLELLEAVPHVLQILGMGTKRLLTLTHRAQVKRFTQDLLKLLKFQASKQVVIRDFMQAYHWCYSKDWNVIDYGMCDLMDLLTEIPDTTITISQQDNDTVISVPKRERTMDEVERTKQFGKEVVDLLRHQPHCRMPFSKFIPTYHHHFGRQCKLTYYGFSKLLELFEAIPDVLQVLECGEEKVLMLTELERVKALAAQLVKLLRAQRDSSLPAGLLLSEYSKTFGYGLRLQDYDVSSLPALLNKLCHVVKVVDVSGVREVQLISRKSLRSLTCQLLALLMSLEEPRVEEGIGVEELGRLYAAAHGAALNPCEYGFLSLSELLKSLPYLVELFHEQQAADEGECGAVERVRLTRLYQFARSVRGLLHTYHYHQIFLTEFPGAYSKFTGRSLQPRAYGYASMDDLLSAVPQVVWIKGHGHKRIIVLKNDMRVRSSSAASDSPQPDNEEEEDEDEDEGELSQRDSPYSEPDSRSSGEAAVDSELLCLTSPVDLLCGPVPSCLPSPQLHPDPVLLRQDNLILFDEHSRASAEGDDAVDVDPMVVDEARRPPEQQSSPAVDCEQQPGAAIEPAAAKTAQPSSINMSSIDSPLKRAPRTKTAAFQLLSDGNNGFYNQHNSPNVQDGVLGHLV